MQCETRSSVSQTVYAKDEGFLKSLDVSDGGSVKRGHMIFQQENPFISWNALEWKLQASLLDRELDQIRATKKRLEEAQIQVKRLEHAKENQAEFSRRSLQLSIAAAFDGVFVLSDRRLKPGKWLAVGEQVGELFDPATTEAIAYASESDVSKLKPGDRVSVFLNGSLASSYGRIVLVNGVPLKSPASLSPLLDIAGGPVQTVRSPEDQSLRLQVPLYMVRIALDTPSAVPAGRTGLVKARKFQSLGGSLLRLVLSTLQREFSF